MTDNNKQTQSELNLWTPWGVREYQSLVQYNTHKTIEFWTNVLNFWWGKQ